MFKYSPNIAINVRAVKSCGTEMQAGPITLWIDGCGPVEEAQVGKVFFEFLTEDLANAAEFLKSKGCKLGEKTEGENFKGRMIIDPFRMNFHLYQPLKKKEAK